MPREGFALEDAIAAVYLSVQSLQIANSNGQGYLVLINGDGDFRAMKTSGMDNAQIAWSPHGLFFSDVDNDYRLTDTLTVTESPKARFQQTIAATDDGSAIALYNNGFTASGNTEQLVVTDQDSVTKTEVEGYYHVTGFCDGTLYGIAPPSGRYHAIARHQGLQMQGTHGDTTALMFNQLSHTERHREQLLGLTAVSESTQSALDAPCEDGVLHHLGSTRDGEQHLPVLRSWDTETGEYSEKPLNVQGTMPLPTSADTYYLRPDSGSIRDGHFEWVCTDGRVMSTDLQTGDTTERFVLTPQIDTSAAALPWHRNVTFTEDRIVTLTWDAASETYHYTEFDRDTGKQRKHLELPSLAEELGNPDLVMRDLAVR